ncbi:uncharacterized protein LOC130900928 isoform X2 [Diorhabda carinulata]|uniref:uncharacterized protein LOC130900928 isoform X2 n=1 Tax=Diorhabda carinulata TaxID=1163345 RepID=UPI0025A074DE|nr:uncharacterized protein LOC130900928 isoform X2 [Diorhabda carinulata]
MYDLILKRNKQQDKWRFLIISGTCVFFCICIALIILDNTMGIFDLDENGTTNCSGRSSLTKLENGMKPNQLRQKQSCLIQNNQAYCQVTCTRIKAEEIVNSNNFSICESTYVHLILENIEYNDKGIQSNWLEGFSHNIKILEIKGSTISYIGDRSFSESPFQDLSRLVLENTNISYIRKNTFQGSKITDFEFRSDIPIMVDFAFGALQPLSNTLSSFQLNRCILEPQSLVNLTGTNSTLKSLVLMDLRFNSILYLKSYSFVDIPNVYQIFLSSSEIMAMEAKVFEGVGAVLSSLSIDNNKLESLPEGIFDYVSTGLINISGNKWLCNCDLLWFKEFYEKEYYTHFGGGNIPFICSTNEGEKNYTDVDFCSSTTSKFDIITTTSNYNTTTTPITTTITITPESNSTTTNRFTSTTKTTESPRTSFLPTTSTISPTEITLPPINNNLINISCNDCSKRNSFTAKNDRLYSHTVSVRNGTITYDFYEIDDTPYYEIKLRNSVETDYMIWFDTNDHNDVGCEYNIEEVVELRRLKFGKTYIICLLKRNETTVSPFDCTDLLVSHQWDDKPWIVNKDKVLIIALYIVILLVLITVTATVMYCTIKRHPKLIGATKTVYENNISPAPSMYSISDGYLSPKYYERVLTKRKSSRKLSTISERDFEGAFNVVYNVSEFHSYEPPPLPLNHPTLWRKLDNEDEFCSSSSPLRRCNSSKFERFCISPIDECCRSKSLPNGASNSLNICN